MNDTCCILRDGKRCNRPIPQGDQVCAECCDLLEDAIQKRWEKEFAKHDNN